MTNFLIDDLQQDNLKKPVEVSLPTKGMFYNRGEVFTDDTDFLNIKVYPISLFEETIYTDPFLIVSGKSIPKLIKRICPDVVNANLLNEIDLEIILLGSRLASYGDTMSVSHKCQNPKLKDGIKEYKNETSLHCNHETKLKINLIKDIIINYKVFDDEVINQIYFNVPGTKQRIHLKPIVYKDSFEIIKKIYSMNTDEQIDYTKDEDIEKYEQKFDDFQEMVLKTNLAYFYYVETSNGKKTNDYETIKGWYNQLSKDQIAYISEQVDKFKNYINDLAIIKYTCANCEHENSFRLEFDPQKFFTKVEDTLVSKVSSTPIEKIQNNTKQRSKIYQR